MKTIPQTISLWLATAALLCSLPIQAQNIPCDQINDAVSEAKHAFKGLMAEQTRSESLADWAEKLNVPVAALAGNIYQSTHYKSKLSFDGANLCEVINIRVTDEESDLETVALECQYANLTSLPKALIDGISSCVGHPAETIDATAEIAIDVAESDEGYHSLGISIVTDPIDGTKVAVMNITCVNNEPGGCDSDDD